MPKCNSYSIKQKPRGQLTLKKQDRGSASVKSQVKAALKITVQKTGLTLKNFYKAALVLDTLPKTSLSILKCTRDYRFIYIRRSAPDELRTPEPDTLRRA